MAQRLLSKVLLALGFACLQATATAATVKYMVLEEVEPFQIVTRGNPMYGGLVTEVVSRIFRDSPHQLQAVVAPSPRLNAMRSKGRLGNWLSYGAKQWLQPGWQLSKEPVYTWHHVLLVPRQSEFQYHRVNDLFGHSLILMHGYDYPGLDGFLRSRHPHGRIIDQRALSQEGALRMLRAGRGVGYIDTNLRVRYNLRQQGLSPAGFRFYDLSAVIPNIELHLMYSKLMPQAVKELIDRRLAEMRQSSELAAIAKRYQ
ncbi:substrate-binding periplasmic protein [Vogesella oryzae]|uniref:substrate-binding periplasmic protein n=1 Tax=Vogesella oryzae TaxID=1735285 RepID=UPI001581ED33|nr:hypothetical protein [Vogesella oryzae]